MANIAKLMGVTIANLAKVLGVSKSTLKKIMGLDISSLPPVAGYVLWVDASGLATGTGINAATTPVSNLGSQGGSFNSGGYDVVASGIGTKNALKFNGTDQHLLSTDAYSNSGTTLTMFVVQQRISDKGQYSGSLASVQDGDNNDYDLARNFTYHQMPTTGNMGGQRLSADMPALTHPGNGVSFIGTFKFDNTNCTHYQKTPTTDTNGSVASTGSFNCDKTVLAARWYSAAVNSRNNIYIGEVLIYNSALNDTDRESVEDYLAAKWGI
jgi:hypothetical protein